MPKRFSKKPDESIFSLESTDWRAPIAEFTKRDCCRKNPDAVALGKLGGKTGSLAPAKNPTARQYRKIAQKAAAARLGKPSKIYAGKQDDLWSHERWIDSINELTGKAFRKNNFRSLAGLS